jgi:hypothetical protein
MKRLGVPSVAIEPRSAVTAMRPYKPPLEGRWGKLRLDFNENPMGCSPSVRRALAKLGSAARSRNIFTWRRKKCCLRTAPMKG